MAITDNFSLTRALNSSAYAYQCWYNVMYGGNTMEIPDDAMGQICNAWESQIKNWEARASQDENDYDLDDGELSTRAEGDENSSRIDEKTRNKAVEKGKSKTEENTGFDGEADNTTGSRIINWSAGIYGTLYGIAQGIAMASKKFDAAEHSPYIAAALGTMLMANALYLRAADPNGEATAACQTMMETELPAAQGDLAEADTDMAEASDELEELSDEATKTNDDANEEIEEDKTLFDMYKASYEELTMKLQSGQTLTEDEKLMLQELVPLMQELGISIEETTDETTEFVGETYEEMEGYQERFDNASNVILEAQGVTEFAAQFDEATRENASKIKKSATLGMLGAAGAVTGGISGLSTSGFNIAQYIASGVAIATGGVAGWQFKEVHSTQERYESLAETEIEIREETQEIASDTSDVYDERVEIYDGQMENIEEMEIQVPDDLEAPKEVPIIPMDNGSTGSNPFAPTGNNGQGNGTNGTGGVGGSGNGVSGTTNTNGAGATNGGTNTTTNGTDSTNGNTATGNTGGTTGGDNTKGSSYNEIMGYGADYTAILSGNKPLNNDGKVLVDKNNKVVMSKAYADAITSVTGDSTGKTFDTAKIPQILENLLPEPFNADLIARIQKGEQLSSEYDSNAIKTLTGQVANEDSKVDNSEKATNLCKKVINFYTPIFERAASNGWTSEYAQSLENGSFSIEEALKNGELLIV